MYKPPQEILDKYADVLINCALHGGKGVKEDEVVLLQVPEVAKPFLVSLRRAVMKAKAHPIIQFMPDNMAREFFELANQKHLEFFPAEFLKGRLNQIDHKVVILAETNMKELEGIPPEKIMTRTKVMKPYKKWQDDKEDRGEFTWTLALYGTHAMAQEAQMSLEEYWQEIISACYLNLENPSQKWKEIIAEIDRVRKKLDEIQIEKIHVKGKDIDLVVGIGEKRTWQGGSGRNIPSYEVYISPDWRTVEGKISFNQPFYRYGNLVKGVSLEFHQGKVVNATAEQGEEILKEMIKVENADKVGEFSLTDSRLSKVTKFMADTLYDENIGGKFGNMHIALGSAYKNCYPGDPSKVSDKEWQDLGYNESVVHTDIVTTEDREVTAYLKNGEKIIIYQNGIFTI